MIDLDYNFQNPITNTRTLGSDPDRVLRLARAYMKGLHEHNIAVTIKHWPGDGVDGRDQHLLTSVNTLSCEDWDRTYGKVYRGMIEAGANTVMSAHIQLPAYSRQLVPGIRDEDILPASRSRAQRRSPEGPAGLQRPPGHRRVRHGRVHDAHAAGAGGPVHNRRRQ